MVWGFWGFPLTWHQVLKHCTHAISACIWHACNMAYGTHAISACIWHACNISLHMARMQHGNGTHAISACIWHACNMTYGTHAIPVCLSCLQCCHADCYLVVACPSPKPPLLLQAAVTPPSCTRHTMSPRLSAPQLLS